MRPPAEHEKTGCVETCRLENTQGNQPQQKWASGARVQAVEMTGHLATTLHPATLACSLNDTDFRERRALMRKTLLPSVTSSKRTANGLHLSFANTEELCGDLETFVHLERQCCGFLTFTVTPQPASADAPLTLLIEGPSEASATIEMFARTLERPV
jgi:hypothetical protein